MAEATEPPRRLGRRSSTTPRLATWGVAVFLAAGCAHVPPDYAHRMSSEQPSRSTLEELAESLPPAESRLLEIDLATQGFRYYEDDRLVLAGPVSSGTSEHPTPSGSFRLLSKDEDKVSRSYTNYYGMPTPMPYSMQFLGPYFIHEGWVPGQPDSHGCVRLNREEARFLFGRMRVGDSIQISPPVEQGLWLNPASNAGLGGEWLSLDDPRRGW